MHGRSFQSVQEVLRVRLKDSIGPWGGGGVRAITPRGPITGATYLLSPPNRSWAPWRPAWAPDRSIFYQVSGPRGTDQGPAGSIRALQNEPGPHGMGPQDESGSRKIDQGPQDESGPCGSNQGPARRIRASRDKAGPRETDEGRQDKVGLRRTNQGPIDKAGKTNQGAAGRIRPSQDESGPHVTDQGRSKGPHRSFF